MHAGGVQRIWTADSETKECAATTASSIHNPQSSGGVLLNHGLRAIRGTFLSAAWRMQFGF
jgi:hypothetical protein